MTGNNTPVSVAGDEVARMIADLRHMQHPDKPWAQDAADYLEDLVARIAALEEKCTLLSASLKQSDEREAKLREALAKIAELDVPRPVGTDETKAMWRKFAQAALTAAADAVSDEMVEAAAVAIYVDGGDRAETWPRESVFTRKPFKQAARKAIAAALHAANGMKER